MTQVDKADNHQKLVMEKMKKRRSEHRKKLKLIFVESSGEKVDETWEFGSILKNFRRRNIFNFSTVDFQEILSLARPQLFNEYENENLKIAN